MFKSTPSNLKTTSLRELAEHGTLHPPGFPRLRTGTAHIRSDLQVGVLFHRKPQFFKIKKLNLMSEPEITTSNTKYGDLSSHEYVISLK